jgi:hypothetical protein
MFMKSLDYEGDAEFNFDLEHWRPTKYNDYNPSVVISCVDSMDCRKSIYHFVKNTPSVNLFIDNRMQGNILRLLTHNRENLDEYGDSLFSDDEATPGRCTRQSTMYAADILANLAVGQVALYLKGIKGRSLYATNLLDELMA